MGKLIWPLIKHSIFDLMKNILSIILLIFVLSFFSSCNFKITGVYYTNLAEGWRNFTDNQGNHIEVIPETPRYQYFKITWNKKVKWFYYENEIKKNIGTQHWKMKRDTLFMKYHSKRMRIDTFLFKGTNYIDKYCFNYMYTDSSRNSRFLKKCFGDRKVYYVMNRYW